MGRFEHENANVDKAEAVGDTATERLRSSVEQQVRQVVEEAMGRAVAIEDRALVKARQIEQESNGKAEAALQTSIERADGMLAALETLQDEMGKVIGSFREEMETLATELKTAKASLNGAPPVAGPLPSPPVVTEPPVRVDSEEDRAPESQTTPELAQPEPPEPHEPEPPLADVPTAPPVPATEPGGGDRAREMIRQQLVRLRDTGKPRADAERYLTRFNQGEEYKAILDEVYPQAEEQDSSRRRGLLRRK